MTSLIIFTLSFVAIFFCGMLFQAGLNAPSFQPHEPRLLSAGPLARLRPTSPRRRFAERGRHLSQS